MNTPFRIALDAMGGDHAPANEIAGALHATQLLARDGIEHSVVLVGEPGESSVSFHASDRRHLR